MIRPSSFEMTRRFHQVMGLPTRETPVEPTIEERVLRARLLMEETLETIVLGLGLAVSQVEAIPGKEIDFNILDVGGQYDPVETLDGLADVKAVTNGAALVFGLPMEAADREVFESNMSKLDDEGNAVVNRCKHWETNPDSGVTDYDETRAYCQHQLRGAASCPETSHLIDPTQPVGKILKGKNFRAPDIAGLLP